MLPLLPHACQHFVMEFCLNEERGDAPSPRSSPNWLSAAMKSLGAFNLAIRVRTVIHLMAQRPLESLLNNHMGLSENKEPQIKVPPIGNSHMQLDNWTKDSPVHHGIALTLEIERSPSCYLAVNEQFLSTGDDGPSEG